MNNFANIPMQEVGPIKIIGSEVNNEDIMVPLATYETPLWASTARGAKVTRESGGVLVTLIDDRMTRSILVDGADAAYLNEVVQSLKIRHEEIAAIIGKTSRFAKLLNLNSQIVGNLLYLRLEISTGDASGHNMVTYAADALMVWLLEQYSELSYVSVSGNFCTDKKASSVNGILGRGKYVVAEATISSDICKEILKTTPEQIVQLNIKKNLIGTLLSGTVRSANAHFANMLLGLYLATGQDAANIIEGSQGIVFAEVRDNDLYFSVTLPNIIVGTVGNGKDLPFVEETLTKLGCRENRIPGANARRLAIIAAATVFCGELSLLAAQTNQGELMRSHIKLERTGK